MRALPLCLALLVGCVHVKRPAPKPAAAELAELDQVEPEQRPELELGPLVATAGDWLPRLELEVFGQTGAGLPSPSSYFSARVSAPSFVARVTSGIALGLKSGTKLTFDGTTGAKYLTSNGTTLSLVGLNFGVASSSKVCLDGTTCAEYLSFDGTNIYVRGTNLIVPDGAIIGSNSTAIITYGLITSNVGSGANALELTTDGARVDMGTGGSDYWYGDGTGILTPGGLTVGGFVTMQGSAAVAGNLGLNTATYARATLPTCSITYENGVAADVAAGASTGKRSKLCLCTSDGASAPGPAYVWQNLATGTLGTTTTCGTE